MARVDPPRGPQGTLRGRNTTAGAIDFSGAPAAAQAEAGAVARRGADAAFSTSSFREVQDDQVDASCGRTERLALGSTNDPSLDWV